MEKRVSISISEGIADVRLVRADKMNALDAAMFDALVAASNRLAQEKGVRAVVLSGEGRSFCAGLDMGRFAAMKEKGGNEVAGGETRDLTARTHGLANFPQAAVWGWRQLPVPVIAAIQGVAFGGGFQLALGADMRFLSPDARMSIMEIKWGWCRTWRGRRSWRASFVTTSCASSVLWRKRRKTIERSTAIFGGCPTPRF
jgi:enoyl-CoA hydratase/carnithine racemase